MLRLVQELSDAYEYAVIAWGQSNMTPQGLQSSALTEDPHLVLKTPGADITVDIGAGTGTETIPVDDLLVAGAWAGATLRLGSPTAPLAGYGTISNNTAVSSGTVTAVDTDLGYLTVADHGVYTGAKFILTGSDVPAPLVAGTTYYVIRQDDDKFQVATSHANAVAGTAATLSDAGSGTITATFGTTITLTWSADAAVDTDVSAYIYYADSRHHQFEQVRVLTPYLPDQGGAYSSNSPNVPGYTISSSVTTESDLALFLPFTFYEGIGGFGVADVPSSGAGATTITVNAGIPPDLMDGGHIRVTSTTGVQSYGTITATADDNTFTTASGDIDTGADTFEELGGHNLVTGQMLAVTSDAAFPTGSGLSAASPFFAIRVSSTLFQVATSYDNAVDGIAIDLTTADGGTLTWVSTSTVTVNAWTGGTPSGTYTSTVWLPYWFENPHSTTAGPGFLYPQNESTPLGACYNRPANNLNFGWGTRMGTMFPWAHKLAGALGRRINVIHLAVDASSIYFNPTLFGGTHAWFDSTVRADWNPHTTGGLADRIERLITTIAPAAITADGNTKPLRILGIYGMQGETEAGQTAARFHYKDLLPMFIEWLRDKIHAAGLNYFDKADKIPFVHGLILTSPWNSIDTTLEVRKAIRDTTGKLPFGATFDPDLHEVGEDTIHFTGKGEVENAREAADLLLQLLMDAVASEENLDDPIAIRICNMALAHIGESAAVTSLNSSTDSSIQASHCAQFYPRARNAMLEASTWSFATQRAPLQVLSDNVRNSEWVYAYGYPDNCAKVFAVLPPEAGDDYSVGPMTSTPSTRYPSSVVASTYTPKPFKVQADRDGTRIIYTNVEDAVARYNVVVNDASKFSESFQIALSHLLASFLAGPIIKGDAGKAEAKAQMQLYEFTLAKAKDLDAGQRDIKPDHNVDWIAGR